MPPKAHIWYIMYNTVCVCVLSMHMGLWGFSDPKYLENTNSTPSLFVYIYWELSVLVMDASILS